MTDDGRTVPNAQHPDVVTFKVFSDGAEISVEYRVASVVIERAINRIATAFVTLLDGDVAKETFEISEKPEFAHGKTLEIKAGYRSDETSIFKGVIVRHGLKVAKGKPSALKIECKNTAIKLSSKRSNKYFYDAKDSEILEEIIKAAGLKPEVQASKVKHKEMVQFYASDWDFLVARAEANGQFVLTNDDKIVVQKPDFGQTSSLTLRYGGNVVDFELEADARTQIQALKATSWNPAEQAIADADAANGNPTVPGNFSANDLAKVVGNESVIFRLAGTFHDDERQVWADARLVRHQLGRVHGRVGCQGFPGIKPGQIVELEGMGARFNGKAFIAGIRHDIFQNEWRTDLQIGFPAATHLEKNPNAVALSAGGLVPAIQGMHVGLVTKLESDPEGEDRIQVRLPMIDPSGEGVWARVACLDAGKERGAFFRPELGDEVILGFIDNDPRQPVVLGMLNSSAKPAPFPGKDKNPKKGFVTLSKLKVVFDDDKKEITIETPGGNKLILSDDTGGISLQDKNKNKLTLDSKGITLESASDLILKAKGSLKGEATGNLDLKSSAQTKVVGSMGAEFSASGTTVVKGTIVQIN